VPNPQARKDAFEKILEAEAALRRFVQPFGSPERFNEFHQLLALYRTAVATHAILTVVK